MCGFVTSLLADLSLAKLFTIQRGFVVQQFKTRLSSMYHGIEVVSIRRKGFNSQL